MSEQDPPDRVLCSVLLRLKGVGRPPSQSTPPTSFPFLLSAETDLAKEISKLKPGYGFHSLVS